MAKFAGGGRRGPTSKEKNPWTRMRETRKAALEAQIKSMSTHLPDMEHLAKENAIPASAASLATYGSERTDLRESFGTQVEIERERAKLGLDPKRPEGSDAQRGHADSVMSGEYEPKGQPAASDPNTYERSTDDHIAEMRAKEGAGGTKTPEEGDEVMVKGNVHGAGKRGVVDFVAPSGSFMQVSDPKTGESLGSFHSSNLQVRGERTAKKPGSKADRLMANMDRTRAQQGSSDWDESKHPRVPSGQGESGGEFTNKR